MFYPPTQAPVESCFSFKSSPHPAQHFPCLNSPLLTSRVLASHVSTSRLSTFHVPASRVFGFPQGGSTADLRTRGGSTSTYVPSFTKPSDVMTAHDMSNQQRRVLNLNRKTCCSLRKPKAGVCEAHNLSITAIPDFRLAMYILVSKLWISLPFTSNNL